MSFVVDWPSGARASALAQDTTSPVWGSTRIAPVARSSAVGGPRAAAAGAAPTSCDDEADGSARRIRPRGVTAASLIRSRLERLRVQAGIELDQPRHGDARLLGDRRTAVSPALDRVGAPGPSPDLRCRARCAVCRPCAFARVPPAARGGDARRPGDEDDHRARSGARKRSRPAGSHRRAMICRGAPAFRPPCRPAAHAGGAQRARPRRARPRGGLRRRLVSPASAIERDAVTSPPARPGREGRREVLDAAALGADARQQERRARHQLAHAREVLGRGGADHRADVGEPARPPPSSSTSRARRSHSGRRRPAARSCDVGGAGVGGADEHEHPGPGGARGLDQRLERVAAEQRVDGQRVGARGRRRAEGRRRRADQRLRVGGGGDGDVAALAVGDDEQAGGAGVRDTSPRSAAQPGAPSRSKHASCGLTATHAGPAASISAAQWPPTAAAARSAAVPDGGAAPTAPGHSRAGSGSRPSTSWDSQRRLLSRAASASRPSPCRGATRSAAQDAGGSHASRSPKGSQCRLRPA